MHAVCVMMSFLALVQVSMPNILAKLCLPAYGLSSCCAGHFEELHEHPLLLDVA